MITIELIECLLWWNSMSLQHRYNLCEDSILPSVVRINKLQPSIYNFIFILKVIALFLKNAHSFFSFHILTHRCLHLWELFSHLSISIYIVSIFHLKHCVFGMHTLILTTRHCIPQLCEQEFKLLDSTSFPFFKRVNTLLSEGVLLSQVSLTIVILPSKQVFLLCQGLILTCQSEQIDIEEWVLLG